ncbi:tRNA cyclic N6-threonylcarbamoyladenosine(37) synthase TcdA [Zoogloea sp.]|uniref:tRNA cyclic N6-threonylcarbamoyladenosine(37) synthase TcdA n=1 Tax=Zoogloea sp. TaxID=49181 RepID=UPI0035AFCC21
MDTADLNLPDDSRRFGGIARLYGDAGRARLAAAHVCVVGIGGVGSWAVEALARTGVGRLTLIDLDHVAESNINRQIHAADATLGQAKVEAMRERVAGYNPACQVAVVDDFVTVDNAAQLLAGGFDYVVDAIDAVRVKVAMIAVARELGLPLVTCGAAGGQIDPTQIRVDDLARTIQDPLLAKVRGQLRKAHGFTRDPKKKFGVEAVFSTEPLRYPAPDIACEVTSAPAQGPAGLNCAGFGSVVTVTACVGMFAAARVINGLASGQASVR